VDEAGCSLKTLLVIQDWKEWLECQRAVQPSRGTTAGWRNVLTANSVQQKEVQMSWT